MGKAKEIVSTGRLGGREVEELAFAAHEIGSALLRSSTSGGEANSATAIIWLLEASDLLENRDEGFAKDMHVSRSILMLVMRILTSIGQIFILECLAQAYLSSSPPRSGWMKAEEVLTQLLVRR